MRGLQALRGEAPKPRVPADIAAAPAVTVDGAGGRWGDGPDSLNPSDDPVATTLEGEFDRVLVCESGGGAEVAQRWRSLHVKVEEAQRRRRILLSKSIIAQGDFQREAVPGRAKEHRVWNL